MVRWTKDRLNVVIIMTLIAAASGCTTIPSSDEVVDGPAGQCIQDLLTGAMLIGAGSSSRRAICQKPK